MTFKVGDKVRFKASEKLAIADHGPFVFIVRQVVEDTLSSSMDKIYLEDRGASFWWAYRFEKVEEVNTEKKPHKHAAEIKAWAEGATIEFRIDPKGEWVETKVPKWHPNLFYRVKPEPKPDVVKYGRLDPWVNAIGIASCTNFTPTRYPSDNLKATWDGETGKLKAVELLSK